MIVPATITFDGWATVELSLDDDFDFSEPIPDQAVESALCGSWDDFGVYQVHNVEVERDGKS